MLRFLIEATDIPKQYEELLAVCILEDVSFESMASPAIQKDLQALMVALEPLPVALKRELAISTLKGLLP